LGLAFGVDADGVAVSFGLPPGDLGVALCDLDLELLLLQELLFDELLGNRLGHPPVELNVRDRDLGDVYREPFKSGLEQSQDLFLNGGALPGRVVVLVIAELRPEEAHEVGADDLLVKARPELEV
jgi:hypothetical protein